MLERFNWSRRLGRAPAVWFVRRSGEPQQRVRGSFCRSLWARGGDLRGTQQIRPIRHTGSRWPGVQLCNVRLEELLQVEICRRGIHSDAYGKEKLRTQDSI